jgi:serine/threonine protein phosphatase PrpC
MTDSKESLGVRSSTPFPLINMSSGSELVSEHLQNSLHNLLAQRPEFEKNDWGTAIKAALAEEDRILLETFKNDSVEPAISGSTVAMCCINLTHGELVVSNLGDSHVILAERDPNTEYPYHVVRIASRLS